MITMLMKEQTFNSRWFGTKGTVRVEIKRKEPAGLCLVVDINNRQYDETLWGISWQEAKLIYNKVKAAADALIFQHSCVVADGEVWLMSKEKDDTITVSCKTAQHFCEGLKINVKAENNIKEQVRIAIETEPPF